MPEPRTADEMVRAGVERFMCQGRPIGCLEMQRLNHSTQRNKSHCRISGECEAGCRESEQKTHHITGQRICRWTSQPCPQQKLGPILNVLNQLKIGGENDGTD
jgi:hypothetical protein